ncbi:drug/metabolite transporter (DMT)-like permease [Catenulispora sp. GP43]|uniref:DMT family transporter n=1 Tax=Catenulispora sp. GP43 TaxID=3156263 RepID=UPI0035177F15
MTVGQSGGDRAVASGLGAVVMWGLAPVFTRSAVTEIGPLTLLVLRALIAGLVCLPLCVRTLKNIARTHLARLVIAGLLGMVGYTLPVAFGLRSVPSSIAALILATEPIWIMCLGRVFAKEHVAFWAWIASALAMCGVAAVIGPSLGVEAGGRMLVGLGLVTVGTILFGAYTIVLRPLSQVYGSTAATTASTLIGALPYLVFAGLAAPHRMAGVTAGVWGDIAFLAVGSSVAGMLLWNRSVTRMGSTKAGLLLFLEPLIGVAGGIVLLGEHFSLESAVGGLLVVVGVVMAWLAQRRRTEADVRPGSSTSAAVPDWCPSDQLSEGVLP